MHFHSREGKVSEPQSWYRHPLLLNNPSTLDKVMQLWGTLGAIFGTQVTEEALKLCTEQLPAFPGLCVELGLDDTVFIG